MTLKLEATIPSPGEGPAGLAWDGNHLWHADYDRGQILQLDPVTGEVLASLRCPGNLAGLTWDGHSLWQSLYDEGLLRQINPVTNDFDSHIDLSQYGWLSGVAWDGKLLWVVAQQEGRLLGLQPDDGRVVQMVDVPVAVGDIDIIESQIWLSTASPMIYDPQLQQFDWTSEPAYELLEVDGAGGSVASRISADGLYTGLAWTDSYLWLAQAGSKTLQRYSKI